MLDPAERKYYDSWLDSGISVSYSQFRGLKDTVKTSMHWAVPKTGAMLEVQKSPLIKEEGVGKPSAPQEDDEEDSGISLSSCIFEGLTVKPSTCLATTPLPSVPTLSRGLYSF